MTTYLDLPLPDQDLPAQVVAEALATPGLDTNPVAHLDRVRDLAQRFGDDILQDVEILELHLARAGCPRPFRAAQRLLARFGALAAVLAADRSALAELIPPEAVIDLKVLRRTAIRLVAAPMKARPLLTAYGPVCDFLKALMRGRPREEFWVVFLDKRNQLIVAERLGRGTVDHAPVYPREVLRRALELNCSAMILAHNHPSGDPEPSRADIEMTKQIITIANAMQIAVHDHLIVGAQEVASFRMLGLL